MPLLAPSCRVPGADSKVGSRDCLGTSTPPMPGDGWGQGDTSFPRGHSAGLVGAPCLLVAHQASSAWALGAGSGPLAPVCPQPGERGCPPAQRDRSPACRWGAGHRSDIWQLPSVPHPGWGRRSPCRKFGCLLTEKNGEIPCSAHMQMRAGAGDPVPKPPATALPSPSPGRAGGSS